jgi:hypothetical protein
VKSRSLLSPLGLHTTSLDSVLSPPLLTDRKRPKSWICEPIHEEPSLQDEGTVHLETEHQRHHRYRKLLIRTQSAPLLISTTTTSPIHIKYVALFFPFYSFPYPLSSVLLVLSSCLVLLCLAATHSMQGFAERATLISRPPPPASLPKLCATRSVVSSLPWTTLSLRRFVLPQTVPTATDHIDNKAFDTEMQAFFYLFTRYLAERAKSQDLYAIHLVFSLLRSYTPF